MGAYMSQPVKDINCQEGKNAIVAFAAAEMQGWRTSQEDAHNSVLDFDNELSAALFAVYDGHGGSDVSKVTADEFPKFLKDLPEYKSGNLLKALEKAFLHFDTALLSKFTDQLAEAAKSNNQNDQSMDDDAAEDEDEDDDPALLEQDAQISLAELLPNYKPSGSKSGMQPSPNPRGRRRRQQLDKDAGEEKSPLKQSKTESGESVDQDDEDDADKTYQLGDKIEGCESGSEEDDEKDDTEGDIEDQGEASDESENENSEDDDEDEDDLEEDSDEDDSDEEGEGITAKSLQRLISGGLFGRPGADGENDEEDERPGFGSGSTAVVALLIGGAHLFVSNVGDSRCVLGREGKAVEMSYDHKPEDDLEKTRVQKAGGFVNVEGRVNGGLNLSRAFGDHSYKQNEDVSAEEQMITALPDVTYIKLDKEKDKFLVLACDGIWNSKDSQEVVEFVQERLDKNQEPKQICEELFNECLAPDTNGDGTGCDNMTCIIVRFDQLEKLESESLPAHVELPSADILPPNANPTSEQIKEINSKHMAAVVAEANGGEDDSTQIGDESEEVVVGSRRRKANKTRKRPSQVTNEQPEESDNKKVNGDKQESSNESPSAKVSSIKKARLNSPEKKEAGDNNKKQSDVNGNCEETVSTN